MLNTRLGGKNICPRSVATARTLVGKKVQFLRNQDIDKSGRGHYFPREGTVLEAHGRNINIDGDWVAFSELVEMKEL